MKPLPSTNHYIIDYHTFSNLKQHLYIISQFRKKHRWIIWFLCSWAHTVKIKMLAKLGYIRGFGKKFASKLFQVFGRIQFLIVWVLRSPFPFWLWTKCHASFAEVACILHLQSQPRPVKSSLYSESLWYPFKPPFCHTQLIAFQGTCT